MKNRSSLYLACFLLLAVTACSVQKKLAKLQEDNTTAELSLDNSVSDLPELEVKKVTRDTLKVKDDAGNEIFIMKAIRDDESGDMVANEVLDAAVVTARFRNIAERQGKVDLAFQVTVPASMQDSKWQLRFNPDMFIMEDSLRLEPVVITGANYRKAQLKGYQQYERFLSKIISDSTQFVNLKQLEVFIRRNIPQIYAFRNDSSYVSDEQFYSAFGVSEDQAIDHYTNKIARSANERRKSRKDQMFRRYVKAPIVTEGIRLDTVIIEGNGDFTYHYVQTINTRPKLRKVDIVLSGDIYDQEKKIYNIPRTEPLTFYISSISAFADMTERYLTRVVERAAEANTACYVDFAVGKSDVDIELGHNRDEIGRIKGNLADLMTNANYDLDSIVVGAYASPEGRVAANDRLSEARSKSISKYLDKYIKEFQDSLEVDYGFEVDENGNIKKFQRMKIPFVSRSFGENWGMLDRLVQQDTTLTDEQKENYSGLSDRIADLDAREIAMQKEPYYQYLRKELYPRLRTVRFNFYLHRKGMIKDTVHTTTLDTAYMRGVQLLKDMDYLAALDILLPYNDYNTAVAFSGLNRNLSAFAILSELERTPEVNYLLAVIYSRLGDPEKAVECYMKSCAQNHQYVYRGNLDPEISVLIRTYGLNQEPEDDFGDLY